MGILTNKDNEPNSGKELEDMLDKFSIDLDDYDAETEEVSLSEKRKLKKERDKESF